MLGLNYITNVFLDHGYYVFASDLIKRLPEITVQDFLTTDMQWDGNIVTNPLYSFASQFVEKAMDILKSNRKLATFLKLTFLESKSRVSLFRKYPPKIVYISASRIACVKNGNLTTALTLAVRYAMCGLCEKVYRRSYNQVV